MKYAALVLASMLAITSCGGPVRGSGETPVIHPSQATDFRQLFARNCSACHGEDGQGGLTVGIARPLYLAIADDATIRRVVEEGRPGTAMPAFGQNAGGMLAGAQIDILVRGIRAHAARPGSSNADKPPAYAASQPGDPDHGQNVFKTLCSPCHGPGGPVGSISDSSYLALVTDQHLRTVAIVGMPQLGMPDWRAHSHPLSDADVTDVVAWLAAQRLPLSAQANH